MTPEIEFARYGFAKNDLVGFSGIINSSKEKGSIEEAVDFLNKVYTTNIAAEFLHMEVIKLIQKFQSNPNWM